MAIWVGAIFAVLEQKHGPQPSEKQVQQTLEDMRARGQMPRPRPAKLALVLGVVCALAGLATAVHSLLRQERRRVMAIIACAACACLASCQAVAVLLLTISVGG